MATRYPSDYDNRSRVEPGISRTGRGGSSSRAGYSGQRPASRAGYSERRPASGQRPPQRSSGQRTGGQRPPQRSGYQQSRRPAPRRRKPNYTPVIAALAVVLVLVLVLVIAKPFGRPANDPVTDAPAVPASNPVQNTAPDPAAANSALLQAEDEGEPQVQYDNIADKLADSEYDVGSLSAEEMAQVSDLKINTSLSSDWLNVLLLGTDERTLSDSARTDTMMIASINRKTSEVKLTSIMRDLAIEFTDIGKYNGTYRINAANYFGGPNLAMRTINEKFGMNIQYYVMVNFFGFSKIVQRLGGIEVDITEAEMEIINRNIVKQFKMAYKANITDFDPEQVFLESYGPNTHLNGNQTLAYARIRKLNGGDYMRTTRQQTVLSKLMEKAKSLSALEITGLAAEMIDQVKTNIPLEDLVSLGIMAAGNGISKIETFRLPIQGSYKEEKRNDDYMLWDCDFQANATKLYDFIYY